MVYSFITKDLLLWAYRDPDRKLGRDPGSEIIPWLSRETGCAFELFLVSVDDAIDIENSELLKTSF